MKKLGLILCLFCLLSGLNAQVFEIQGKELHRAIPDATVDSVWSGIGLPWGMTGKDIIIGFTDWGFDYTHPVFYDTSMTRYRVLRAWDQFKKRVQHLPGLIMGGNMLAKLSCWLLSVILLMCINMLIMVRM